jgi:hypothetical protein
MKVKNFFLATTIKYLVRTKNPTPEGLIAIFHDKLEEKHIKNDKILRIVHNIIEDMSRKINIVTEDEIEKERIRVINKTLSDLEREIRNYFHKEDMEFLYLLRKVVKYNPDVKSND